MNLNFDALRATVRQKGAGLSPLGMNNLYGLKHSKKYKVKKDKIEEGSTWVHLYGLQLAFPFNPFNLDDTMYSDRMPYIPDWSCTTSGLLVVDEMKKNPRLAKYLCDLSGVTLEELDLDNTPLEEVKFQNKDGVKNAYWRLLEPYRGLVPYACLVQNYKYTAFGKYGRKMRSSVTYGEDGVTPVGQVDLGYKLYQLESAITNNEISMIEEKYKEGGEKYGAPETDLYNEKKEVWKKMAVNNPYLLGTLRYCKFKTDVEYTVDNAEIALINKDRYKALQANERWGSGNLDEITKLENYLGKKADIYFDFLEIGIGYPRVESANDQGRALAIYKARDVSNKPDERIGAKIPKIEEIFREFRDDTDTYSEEVMLRSVSHYNMPDDSKLLSAAKTHIREKMNFLSENILTAHNDILTQIDPALSEELLAKLSKGALPKGTDNLDINNLIREDEMTPGSGIDMTEEDTVISEEDLEKELEKGVNLEV